METLLPTLCCCLTVESRAIYVAQFHRHVCSSLHGLCCGHVSSIYKPYLFNLHCMPFRSVSIFGTVLEAPRATSSFIIFGAAWTELLQKLQYRILSLQCKRSGSVHSRLEVSRRLCSQCVRCSECQLLLVVGTIFEVILQGTYQGLSGQTTCLPCSESTYNDQTTQSRCKSNLAPLY